MGAGRRAALWSVCGLGTLAVMLIGIFLAVPFPLWLFPKILRSQLPLKQNDDGEYTKATYYWSNLPADTYYDFYLFNVTNQDAVVYEGAKPIVAEMGPFSYLESEFKEYIEFTSSQDRVAFQNNKTWVRSPSTSCAGCDFDAPIILPNVGFMALANVVKSNHLEKDVRGIVFDILSILLFEYPFRTVTVQGVLFDAYYDPLVAFINSNLSALLSGVMNNTFLGVTLPSIPYAGYFPHYNHSRDEYYTAFTGQGDSNRISMIETWSNYSLLPWWYDVYAQNVTGARDGAFNKPYIKKDDKWTMFQSFTCRTFHMEYANEQKTIHSMPAYAFVVAPYDYDATLPLNKGYRYENIEGKDYYPMWPCNASHVYNPSGQDCSSINCDAPADFCSPCCNGSFIGGRHILPPGIVPLQCLPGQNVRVPFPAFLSPPHFVLSPQEVVGAIEGLHPDPAKHDPGKFYIHKVTGATLEASFRIQLSIPIFQEDSLTLLMSAHTHVIPCFWMDIRVVLKDYMIHYLQFNTLVLYWLVIGLGILLFVGPILIFLLCFGVRAVRRQRSSGSSGRLNFGGDALSGPDPRTDGALTATGGGATASSGRGSSWEN